MPARMDEGRGPVTGVALHRGVRGSLDNTHTREYLVHIYHCRFTVASHSADPTPEPGERGARLGPGHSPGAERGRQEATVELTCVAVYTVIV